MYYAVIAGKSMKDPAAHIYVFGPPATLKDALRSAEVHYRRDYKCPPNQHVMTTKIEECESEEQMIRFMEELAKIMEENE